MSISAATLDVRVRIWRKEHESLDPSCLVSMVQAAGGVMVCGIFSWHTFGPLVPIEHRLNATAYLSIVTDHVHPFMTTVYPSSDATSSRIMHNITKLKSAQTGFLYMTMSSLYSRGGESWPWRAGVPAGVSSNPNQTHLNGLIKVFRMQLDIFFSGFFRVGAKLCRRVALQDQRSPPLLYSNGLHSHQISIQ